MKSPLSFLTSWVALALVASACSDARPADGDATSNATLADAGAGTSSDVPEGATPAPEPQDTDPEEAWAPPTESGDVTLPYTAYRCGYAVRQMSPSNPRATFHAAAVGSAPAPKNLHLTIAGNAASSVVVQWATDAATKQTEVRFGESPDKLDKVLRGFSFASGSRRQHEVHLCGLPAGKTFYYDAGGEGGGAAGRSKVHKVTTAPDGPTPVTLLVCGDTRSDPRVFGRMAQAALAEGPTAMLLSGDAVAIGSNQSQWDDLFASAPDLFAELPGLWTHGNHEGLDELYFQQLALPDNGGPAAQAEQWFGLTYGPLRVLVLNDTVSSSAQITGVEKSFLDMSLRAVDRARTPYVVTMHHQPMYTTSANHGSNTALRAAWGPLLDQYKVEVDIAGHVHSYESTLPLKAGTTTVTTEAAGTRFFNFGGGGAPLYSFGTTQPYIKTREKTNGFAIMKVDASAIAWTAYRGDASIVETIAIPPHAP